MSAAPLPSRHVTEGMHNALHRIYFHAMGLGEAEIHRPMVGVVAAWDGAAEAGEAPLHVATAAQDGVWAQGATPRQFATIADDERAGGAATLVGRELVADSVELTVRGHCYDALVGVSASANALAGLLLALCRLDVAGLVVPLAGTGELAAIAETLGLAPPGAAGARTRGALSALAREAGRETARRLEAGETARRVVTAQRLRRAAAELADPGHAVHLAAIATECGLAWDVEALVGAPARWVRGTLAPDGALVGAVGGTPVSGPARVFDDEERALAAGWSAGEVLVVRGQGPAGAPGLRRLDRLAAELATAPAPALVVTDGRLHPVGGVPVASLVTPEAAAGGPLATLADGDAVTLGATLDAAIRAGREAARPTPPTTPVLAKYASLVGPATGGAATHPGARAERRRYADF
jgi:dihydroxyacid dehydratase/phosphogluconate dehydratase